MPELNAPTDPLNDLAKKVIDNANLFLEGKITADEWEANVKKILGETK